MQRLIMWAAALMLWGGAVAGELKVTFNTDKPPFAFIDQAGNAVGIEVDVMRTALARLGFEMQAVPISKSHLLLTVKAGKADIAASVQGKDGDGIFYSDTMVEYMNTAISRKRDGIVLNRLADLDNYRFVIWQRGWADLGPEFEAKYKPDAAGRFRSNYFQGSTQDAQTRVFWNRRVDVIVIDKTIFAWYRRHLDGAIKDEEELVYHDIFSAGTGFAAAFKDSGLRDRVNGALKAMRADGSYREIRRKYE